MKKAASLLLLWCTSSLRATYQTLFLDTPQTVNKRALWHRALGTYEQGDLIDTIYAFYGFWYGITDDLLLEFNWPQFLRYECVCTTARATRLASLQAGMRYRFYHTKQENRESHITFIGLVKVPTSTQRNKNPLEPPSIDFFGTLSMLHETPTWGILGNIGGRFNSEAKGVRRGHLFNFAIAGLFTPQPYNEKRLNATLMLEINGTFQSKTECFGRRDINSGGTTLYVGPTLSLYKNDWTITTGMQLAASPGSNFITGKNEYRAALSLYVKI